jgi:hypothetical protein
VSWIDCSASQRYLLLTPYTEKYLQLLATNKIKGTKGLQQNYLEKKDEEADLAAKVHPVNKIAKLNEGRFPSQGARITP